MRGQNPKAYSSFSLSRAWPSPPHRGLVFSPRWCSGSGPSVWQSWRKEPLSLPTRWMSRTFSPGLCKRPHLLRPLLKQPLIREAFREPTVTHRTLLPSLASPGSPPGIPCLCLLPFRSENRSSLWAETELSHSPLHLQPWRNTWHKVHTH